MTRAKNRPALKPACPGEAARALVPVTHGSNLGREAQVWAKGRSPVVEDTYQLLIQFTRAHREGKCHGCSVDLIAAVDDQLAALLTGWAIGTYKSESLQREALVLGWQAVLDYDQTRGAFLPHLYTSVARGMSRMSSEDSDEACSRIARVSSARRASLYHELDKEPSAREIFLSVRNWFIAEAVLRARGEGGADLDDTAALAVISSASEEEIRGAKRRLQRDSLLRWLGDEESFAVATGTALRSRLDESPEGKGDSTLLEVLVDPNALIGTGLDVDALLGLIAGDSAATNLVLSRLGDENRRESWEDLVAASPEEISVSAARAAKRASRDRVTDPVMQYAWLGLEIERQVLEAPRSLIDLAGALA